MVPTRVVFHRAIVTLSKSRYLGKLILKTKLAELANLRQVDYFTANNISQNGTQMKLLFYAALNSSFNKTNQPIQFNHYNVITYRPDHFQKFQIAIQKWDN